MRLGLGAWGDARGVPHRPTAPTPGAPASPRQLSRLAITWACHPLGSLDDHLISNARIQEAADIYVLTPIRFRGSGAGTSQPGIPSLKNVLSRYRATAKLRRRFCWPRCSLRRTATPRCFAVPDDIATLNYTWRHHREIKRRAAATIGEIGGFATRSCPTSKSG